MRDACLWPCREATPTRYGGVSVSTRAPCFKAGVLLMLGKTFQLPVCGLTDLRNGGGLLLPSLG